jgi:hypothetical protein
MIGAGNFCDQKKYKCNDALECNLKNNLCQCKFLLTSVNTKENLKKAWPKSITKKQIRLL